MKHPAPIPTQLNGRLGGERIKAIYLTVAMVIVSLISATVLSGFFSSSDTYAAMYQKLDEKRNTVIGLTAASAVASAALTLVPDDTCTPIAEQLSAISKDFSFVIAALLLEKYLLTIFGFTFFTAIVPICCLVFAATRFMERGSVMRQSLSRGVLKLFMFGLVLLVATPVSVFITSKIDDTYKESMEATMQTANTITEVIDDATKEIEQTNPANPLEFMQQRLDELKSKIEQVPQMAGNAIEWVKALLGSFVEAFAVMMVTSILIPILVPIVIYIAFKLLFDQQLMVLQQNVQRLPVPRDTGDAGNTSGMDDMGNAATGD